MSPTILPAFACLAIAAMTAFPPLISFVGGQIENAVVKDGEIRRSDDSKKKVYWQHKKKSGDTFILKIARHDFLQYDDDGNVRLERDPLTPSKWVLIAGPRTTESFRTKDERGSHGRTPFTVKTTDGRTLGFVNDKLVATKGVVREAVIVETRTDLDDYSGK